MKNNDDETAFPVTSWATTADSKGMSLRDWFAGLAMQGMCASEPPCVKEPDERLAYLAYKIANEMMEARKTLG
jgi:hypothetical protein